MGVYTPIACVDNPAPTSTSLAGYKPEPGGRVAIDLVARALHPRASVRAPARAQQARTTSGGNVLPLDRVYEAREMFRIRGRNDVLGR